MAEKTTWLCPDRTKLISYSIGTDWEAGCNSQSTYVFDHEGNQLARFQDIRYTWLTMFCPEKPLLIVKGTKPKLAVYDMLSMSLLHKLDLRAAYGSPQDDGCCFTPDGRHLINSEFSCKNNFCSTLRVYDTETFTERAALLTDQNMLISHIEHARDQGSLYLLGLDRGKNAAALEYGIYKYQSGRISGRRKLTSRQHLDINVQMRTKLSGSTAFARKWYLNEMPYVPLSLEDLFENDNALATLYPEHADERYCTGR